MGSPLYFQFITARATVQATLKLNGLSLLQPDLMLRLLGFLNRPRSDKVTVKVSEGNYTQACVYDAKARKTKDRKTINEKCSVPAPYCTALTGLD